LSRFAREDNPLSRHSEGAQRVEESPRLGYKNVIDFVFTDVIAVERGRSSEAVSLLSQGLDSLQSLRYVAYCEPKTPSGKLNACRKATIQHRASSFQQPAHNDQIHGTMAMAMR
jgi:hypothetical protein